MTDAIAVEEQRSMLTATSCMPEPDTITKLTKRLKVMTMKLLPVEVDPESITEATSSIITPDVIRAYSKAGGDFAEAIPFCLMRARGSFRKDAANNPADFDENMLRSTACEVLARRLVHNLEQGLLERIMSTRYRYRTSDGDVSAPASALEAAIDQQAIIFLSSAEAQHAINALWRGDWVQVYKEDDQVDFVQYAKQGSVRFWDHVDPHRLAVPKYQTAFSIIVWSFFLFVYSQAVQTPLESQSLDMPDAWEFILYIMAFAFFIDEITRTWKALQLTSRPWSSVSFWTVVNFTTDSFLLTAFTLRIISIRMHDDERSGYWHLRAFQVLSCVAPLIWMKLLTVFDNFKVIGVLQIVVFRMIRDSAIFFILLAVLGAGFAQSLFALDAADGEANSTDLVVNGLLQALLGSPDFDSPSERFGYPFGLIIYYGWNLLTSVILLNVLIALFGSSYSNVEEESNDYYLAFFAEKTVSLIRSPDTYLYPPPFNLIEIFLIIPFSYVLSKQQYDRLNKIVMTTIFFVPIMVIALVESNMNDKSRKRLQLYFGEDEVDDEDDEDVQNPRMDTEGGGQQGEQISTEKFQDLIKVFPNTGVSGIGALTKQVEQLAKQLQHLQDTLAESSKAGGNAASDAKIQQQDKKKGDGQ